MKIPKQLRYLPFFMLSAAPLEDVMAQRWVVVAPTSALEPAVFIDAESIGRSDGYSKAWFKYSFSVDQTGVRNTKFRSYLELTMFDCQNKKQATRTVVFYPGPESAGQAIDKHDFKTLDFQELPPGTMGALQTLIVCQATAAKER